VISTRKPATNLESSNMKTTLIAAVLAAACLLLTACGGCDAADDNDGTCTVEGVAHPANDCR
jgi:ABC-type glycerol-3-phosphate transport system substrate-binding protein